MWSVMTLNDAVNICCDLIEEHGPFGIVGAVLLAFAVCALLVGAVQAVRRSKTCLVNLGGAVLMTAAAIGFFCLPYPCRTYNIHTVVIPPDYTLNHWLDRNGCFAYIARKDGLRIDFDAGCSQATRPSEEQRRQFIWWREQTVAGENVWLSLRACCKGERLLLVTYPKNNANFSAKITSEADLAEALSIILTYKPD